MRLTSEITNTLLSSKRIMDFWKALEKYDLEDDDWKANEMVLNHYKELEKTAVKLSNPIMTEEVKCKI